MCHAPDRSRGCGGAHLSCNLTVFVRRALAREACFQRPWQPTGRRSAGLRRAGIERIGSEPRPGNPHLRTTATVVACLTRRSVRAMPAKAWPSEGDLRRVHRSRARTEKPRSHRGAFGTSRTLRRSRRSIRPGERRPDAAETRVRDGDAADRGTSSSARPPVRCRGDRRTVGRSGAECLAPWLDSWLVLVWQPRA